MKSFYYMCVGEKTRNLCERLEVITHEQKQINIEDLKNIIKLFGGELLIENIPDTYIKKENDSFNIYTNYSSSEYASLNILMALGVAFFELDKMKDNEIIEINEARVQSATFDFPIGAEKGISVFAREFLMPQKLFENSLVNNQTKDGFYECKKVAREFNTPYMKVLTRGKDLKLW